VSTMLAMALDEVITTTRPAATIIFSMGLSPIWAAAHQPRRLPCRLK
jgi:hypothetical protein